MARLRLLFHRLYDCWCYCSGCQSIPAKHCGNKGSNCHM